MTTGTDWQDAVGRSWAQAWALTDRSFAGLTEQLLGRIAGVPGDTVLDVGCGAGELSLALARARPRAQIIGLDLSAHLVAAARERAGERTHLRFVQGDAAAWREPDFAPDLLVSRHGVMFFDDPSAAFAHLHDTAAPDAALVFSCFRSPRENVWASGLADLLGLPPGDPLAPGPFAFADPQRVEAILRQAGWGQIDFQPVDFAWIAGVGADAEADALDFTSRIGPAAPALRALEGVARTEAEERLRDWFRQHRSGDIVAFSAAAWIVTAKADRRHRTR
jgi:SAM-dependent methyltransferase